MGCVMSSEGARLCEPASVIKVREESHLRDEDKQAKQSAQISSLGR